MRGSSFFADFRKSGHHYTVQTRGVVSHTGFGVRQLTHTYTRATRKDITEEHVRKLAERPRFSELRDRGLVIRYDRRSCREMGLTKRHTKARSQYDQKEREEGGVREKERAREGEEVGGGEGRMDTHRPRALAIGT